MKELKVMYQARGASFWLGTLADDGRDTVFQYSPEALVRGRELSPLRLPLRAPLYPDHQRDYLQTRGVPGMVLDSLPDGWGLRLMDRRLRAIGIDPGSVSVLDRLAYLGANTMGALSYQPARIAPTDLQDLSLLALANEVQAVLLNDEHEVLEELAQAGGSPGGARPKALVYFNPASGQMSMFDGHVPGGEAWLVKFSAAADGSDSCAMEELYARMAHRCGLGMETTRLFELAGGLTAFGTRRFDRRDGDRVHVHSLAGMLHADFQVPAIGYGDFLRATRRLTRDQREVKKALQRCVFNVLMNNRDDHAKNLAFMLNQKEEWILAPAFDLTYCSGYRGQHFMDVAGEGKSPSRAHIIQLAKEGGLKEKDAVNIIDTMLEAISPSILRQAAAELPVLKKTVNLVVKVIDVNRELLSFG